MRRQTNRRRHRPRRRASLPEVTCLRSKLAAEFPNPRLSVELVPRPLWGKSCASMLPAADWDCLRHPTYRRANYRCETCGGRGSPHLVCHEVWEYDDAARVQRLAGLRAICTACNDATHLGRSSAVGKGKEALAHLLTVNGWTPEQAREYVSLIEAIWKRRSGVVSWRQDLSWLANREVAVPAASRTTTNHEGEEAMRAEQAEPVGSVFDVNVQIENPCSWWDEHSPAMPANRATAMGHIATCPQCRRGLSKKNIRVVRSLSKTGPGTWELRPADRLRSSSRRRPKRR